MTVYGIVAHRSVSWNSLHKPGFTSDETEALSKKAEALEEEVIQTW